MKVRSLLLSDLEELKKLHKEFFDDNFKFPDFNRFLGTFCVVDDNEKILLAGGVKPLLEAILITDKTRTVKIRREALLQALALSKKFCEVVEDTQLHAFVKDDSFGHVLRKYGFKPINGEGLVLNF